jgi:AraC-like DNA-binding protein
VQHVEFFHRDHFELFYHRQKARKSVSAFIDFFWETDFASLFRQYPDGFSDALFPNVGYTYLINLGTPFIMQLGDERFEVKSDGFLPRHKSMICHHSKDNRIFGIKFKVSPEIFEKKINFSEYREFIFPLTYLIDRGVVQKMKSADSFAKRVQIISDHYSRIIEKYAGSLQSVDMVTHILHEVSENNRFTASVAELATENGVSTRTLLRYFESTTGMACKQTLQILRIRKALNELTTQPATFDFTRYGYYDYSHFFKHLKSFINQHTIAIIQPHLVLLNQKREAKASK